MSISLRNSMKLGKFSECEVVAGHQGMDRVIENVTIMEVPDIVKWLKGQELILTSLFAIKDDVDAQNLLIQQLYYAGATALAIKPFETMEGIPDGIIKSADKLGFPVIQIPDHVKYLDILSPIMHYIFNEKVVLQEDLEQATNVLYEISLNSQGVEAFAENLSAITKNIVTIESEFSFIKAPTFEHPISPLSEDAKHELSVIKRPIRYERQYGNEQVPCVVAPIMVDNDYYGNITCWAVNSEHLTMDLAILEKASSLLSLEFLRLKVKYDIEQQYKNEFLRELLFTENIREKDLIEWGESYSIEENKEYVCLLLSGEADRELKVDNVLREVNSTLLNRWPSMLIGVIRNKICMIHPVEGDEIKETCETIFSQVTSKVHQKEFRMGVGEIHKGPLGIRKSFTQAERALKLLRSMKDDQPIIYFKDLGAYRLLEPLIGRQELSEFYDETIGKLVQYDHKEELIHTLQTYFYHNESLKVTAKNLYIHINTLKYRLNRIEEMTNCEIRNTEDKMKLYIGLKIHELKD